MLIILFSPGGISNLITVHLPVWRAGAVKRLMPSYGLAFLTGAITLIGVVGMIELLYRGALFGGVHVVVTWIVSGLMILGGGFFLRRAIRGVRQIWEDLSPELTRWS